MYRTGFLLAILIVVTMACFNSLDRQTPTVEIWSPTNGWSVSDSEYVWIIADDNNEVARVELYIDDTLSMTWTAPPFESRWNTYVYANNSTHWLLAMAYDRQDNRGLSDTVRVTVANEWLMSLPISDNFDGYANGEYPSSGGWKELTFNGYAVVTNSAAYSGINSFMLTSDYDVPRLDGFHLYLENVNLLGYECVIMIPSGTSNGGLVGFFKDPDLCNSVRFGPSDTLVVVKGATESMTGFVWHYDTWYLVRVQLDYEGNTMSVWLDNQLVSSIAAAPRDLSNTFCLAAITPTGSPNDGVAYFDDVKIYKVMK